MPLIRCPKCGQAYDIPGVIAVRLSNSIAACHCGEWLSGSKAAILARMMRPDEIKQVDLQQYRVANEAAPELPPFVADQPATPLQPRSVRIIARGASAAIDTIFTIHEHPLWIGRRGSHVEIDDAELSIRHCSISVRGSDLVLRDAESHTGTFIDGEEVFETVITDGVHVIRAGSALITVEPSTEAGVPVGLLSVPDETLDETRVLRAMQARKAAAQPKRPILVCIDGALNGQEFEIPPTGLVVGREGHVRVPDEYLSRKHFEVIPDTDGVVRVRDLGSRNGTFLNTLPASNSKVAGGDEIRAGVNRFKIEMR